MAVKKEGELRVRKGESIYGPMSRDDFDRLLASGRFSLADFVSVLGGPWTEILQFVSPPAADAEQGHLRVLRGDRIFGSLNHRELKRLRAEGRITDDDLVCTLGGPWMSVADFLAPPLPPEEGPPQAEVVEAEVEAEVEYVPLRWYHVYADEVDVQQVDKWFVRVHGIHSAPLTKRQLRHLLFAREITPACPARHVTWDQEAWYPINSIPELAAVVAASDSG